MITPPTGMLAAPTAKSPLTTLNATNGDTLTAIDGDALDEPDLHLAFNAIVAQFDADSADDCDCCGFLSEECAIAEARGGHDAQACTRCTSRRGCAFCDDTHVPPLTTASSATAPIDTPPAAPPAIELPPSPFVDVAALLAGDLEAPSPSIGRRSDGAHLFYAGAVNVLVGDPESGKSLIAASVAAETLADGGSVLWLDLDHNGAASILARLRAFGVPDAVLADTMRFRLAIVEDRQQLETIIAMSAREGGVPELSVVDSVGELVGLYGGDQNSDADYTNINRATLARLASTGACVLAVDHLAKGSDSRAYGAAGSVAKKRAVDGVMLRVEVVRPFVPGQGGRARLLVVKDRHGGVREVSGAEKAPLAASFEITSGAPLRWRFWAPEEQSKGGPETPEGDAPALSARVLADLATIAAMDPRPTSKSQVQKATGWGSQRALDALRALRDSF